MELSEDTHLLVDQSSFGSWDSSQACHFLKGDGSAVSKSVSFKVTLTSMRY